MDLTELEKRLLCAIDLLSQENYASLSGTLVEETSVVQAVYHSLQEKANDVQKQLGDPLADIEREWDRFHRRARRMELNRRKRFSLMAWSKC
ncbi:hypothetical protein PsorP6_003508 [Peronosclerospora sorghi]|uniref:Uncharacterized protein n=1 Tax=Peronosclerospora sorghi TaxID=230839 RepID=A0ACC0VM13_9STRA|nr:hypothetical protein PsorP6_003508 [Peronosclerospora sorghi]